MSKKPRNRAIKNVSDKISEITTIVKPIGGTGVEKVIEAKPSADVEVFVEYDLNQVRAKDIVEKIKAQYEEAGKNADDIKTLNVYIKPQDNAAYYVINGEENGSIVLKEEE